MENNYQKLVINTLEQQREDIKDLQKMVLRIDKQLASLKTEVKIKSKVFGFLAGSIPVILNLIFNLLKSME